MQARPGLPRLLAATLAKALGDQGQGVGQVVFHTCAPGPAVVLLTFVIGMGPAGVEVQAQGLDRCVGQGQAQVGAVEGVPPVDGDVGVGGQGQLQAEVFAVEQLRLELRADLGFAIPIVTAVLDGGAQLNPGKSLEGAGLRQHQIVGGMVVSAALVPQVDVAFAGGIDGAVVDHVGTAGGVGFGDQ
ncbi:hypothetical protein D3C80_1571180 [compost metagenome]